MYRIISFITEIDKNFFFPTYLILSSENKPLINYIILFYLLKNALYLEKKE